jgi:hypothetical protein
VRFDEAELSAREVFDAPGALELGRLQQQFLMAGFGRAELCAQPGHLECRLGEHYLLE